MATTLITLAAGGLGGAALKAAYDAWTQRRIWQHEDRHRFAVMKQEAYATYLTVLAEYRRARRMAGVAQSHLDDAVNTPDEDRLRVAFREALEQRRAVQLRLIETVHVLRLVGDNGTVDSARDLERLNPADDGPEVFDAAVDRFVAAARDDLHVSSRSRHAAWWRFRPSPSEPTGPMSKAIRRPMR